MQRFVVCATLLAFLAIVACGSTPASTDAGADVVVPHDAGACGTTEESYQSPRPWLLRADNGAVFWEAFGNGVDPNGSIGRIDACGHQWLISGGDMDPRGLAAAEGAVCWASIGAASSSYSEDGYVGCVGPGGYKTFNEPDPRPNGAIAIDAGEVFWARYDGSIAAASLTGGPSRIVVSGTSGIGSLFIQQSTVYFTTGSGVRSVPTPGGAATDVVTGLVADDIAGDGTTLFVSGSTQQSGLGIYRLDATQATLLTSVSNLGNEIAVDATDVYYEEDTSVMKVPKVGGVAMFVAQSTDGYSLTVDDTYVYIGGGGVTRIPKK